MIFSTTLSLIGALVLGFLVTLIGATLITGAIVIAIEVVKELLHKGFRR